MFKGEVIVKDDSEIATVGGWRQGGVVNGEAETVVLVRDLGLIMIRSDL